MCFEKQGEQLLMVVGHLDKIGKHDPIRDDTDLPAPRHHHVATCG